MKISLKELDMLEHKPLIMYRQNKEGKHWLTTLGFPPLQLALVAANQRRVATFVLSHISKKLLERNDVPVVLNLGKSTDFTKKEDIYIQLELEPPALKEDDFGFIADELYLTPRPMGYWAGTYEQWIFMLARKLGMEDAPKPASQSSYDFALQKAIMLARQKIPYLKESFNQGFEEWELYFKVALLNNNRETNFVWAKPISWNKANKVKVKLMSEPYNSDDYWLGQELEVPESYIIDYCLTEDISQFSDNTATYRVAEDYGVIHCHF